MTLEELRTGVRNITKEWEDDAGTLMPSDDVVLDFYINWAAEDVVMDLVEFMPEDFLTYEDISLAIGDKDYDLTAEWLQIWCMQKNVTDESFQTIPYSGVQGRNDVSGETADEPEGWFLKGTTIIFWPTPSAVKANYARCWIVVPEASTIVSAGPTYIPRMAHKMIVLDAAILIGYMNGIEVGNIVALYQIQKARARDSLTNRVQQQPQFIGRSVFDRMKVDSRDKAFYDKSGFFRS